MATIEEKWAWERLRCNQAVNFNERYGKRLEPNAEDKALRQLSGRFLLDVLTDQHLSDRMSPQGVRIIGAYFRTDIDLSHVNFKLPLRIEYSQFDCELYMDRSKFDKFVSFEDCIFNGGVSMLEADFGHTVSICYSIFNKALRFRNDTVRRSLDLRSAKICRSLFLSGSNFAADVDMGGIEVGLDLQLIRKAFFGGKVYLLSAKVHGNLQTGASYSLGTTFRDHLDMGGIEVGRSMFLGGQTTFKNRVTLIESKIDDRLDATNSVFDGTPDQSDDPKYSFNMARSEVNYGVLLSGSKFKKNVLLIGVKVGSDLDVSDQPGTKFYKEVDLTGAKIGQLNSWVRRVEGEDEFKPGKLKLDGLTYERLGGVQGEERPDEQSSWWYTGWRGWLKLDTSYSQQPYQQLAKVFRETGAYDIADDILFAGREKECEWERRWGRRVWLGLLSWSIGYGIGLKYFIALLWVALLTVLGAAALKYSHDMGYIANISTFPLSLIQSPSAKIAYSLDQLLPIVQLDKAYDDIRFEHSILWFYFTFVHKLAGWLLGSFLVAGLAGLTQKR
jgi:hypothetical protein